jgi:bis(5'-nucleosidyl)-tetraphosphatase
MANQTDMGKDEAFGIVPIAPQPTGDLFLLVHHRSGHWSFPKGHAEAAESPQVTACREFEEETGIRDYTLLPVSFVERYEFTKAGRSIEKTVMYFPAIVQSTVVQYQVDEIQDFVWSPYEEALQKITFPQSKQLLMEVKQYLTQVEISTRE